MRSIEYSPHTISRRGMTLVELLIVCFILVLFVALAAPLLRPATADRKVREAARQLNGYIAEAKAYAAQTGRPVGLAFDRGQALDEAARNVNIVSRLYIAESPPLYAGDTAGSVVVVRAMSRDDDGNGTNDPDVIHLQQPLYYMPYSGGTVLPSNAVVEVHPPQINGNKARWFQLAFGPIDSAMMYVITASYIPRQATSRFTPFRIRFAQRGGWYDGYMEYLGASPPTFNPATATTDFRFFCWAPFGKAAPISGQYQIEFPPQIAADTPLELPTGTVVDLQYSGFGTIGSSFRNPPPGDTLPLVVVFSPSGEVDRIFNAGTYSNRASKMHFLVGTLNQAVDGDYTTHTPTNLSDTSNQWVSLAATSGHVTTSDNLGFTPTLPPSDVNYLPNALTQARAFATVLNTKGGR